MICPSCTHENDAARRYCGQCACNLKPVCVRCGFSNVAPDRFCGGCGLGIVAYITAEDAPAHAAHAVARPLPPVRLAAVAPTSAAGAAPPTPYAAPTFAAPPPPHVAPPAI